MQSHVLERVEFPALGRWVALLLAPVCDVLRPAQSLSHPMPSTLFKILSSSSENYDSLAFHDEKAQHLFHSATPTQSVIPLRQHWCTVFKIVPASLLPPSAMMVCLVQETLAREHQQVVLCLHYFPVFPTSPVWRTLTRVGGMQGSVSLRRTFQGASRASVQHSEAGRWCSVWGGISHVAPGRSRHTHPAVVISHVVAVIVLSCFPSQLYYSCGWISVSFVVMEMRLVLKLQHILLFVMVIRRGTISNVARCFNGRADYYDQDSQPFSALKLYIYIVVIIVWRVFILQIYKFITESKELTRIHAFGRYNLKSVNYQ